MFPPVVLLLALVAQNLVHGQDVPRCEPRGLCFPPSGNINPRIVTPNQSSNQSSCPTGFEPCYPYGGTFSCGTRYAPGVTDTDGPSTRGAQPWQVYLMDQTNKYIGSGVMLTDQIVLTAAHKVYLNENSPNNVKVYLGVNNPEGITQPPAALRLADFIVVHENFNSTVLKNDLALIMLNSPYPMGYRVDLGLGCLPRSTDTFVDDTCTVGGWGETQFQSKDEGRVHKQVKVKVVSMATCKASMERTDVIGVSGTAKYLDTNNELCAGGVSQKDACTQDGGAPLMCLSRATNRYVVAGLVIWGKGCGRAGVYGVYVDVAKYASWIATNTQALLQLAK